MRLVQSGPVLGLLAQPLLLGVLGATVGLGEVGWSAGLVCAAVTNSVLALGLARNRPDVLRPADWVTLTRATLVCAVAALTADSFVRPVSVPMLVGVTTAALVLDGVDGWVARRTRTASSLGARFDMEVDAFLILVLSVYVAGSAGAWVLAIGSARYALGVAGWLRPWLRRASPRRPWAKVVAATQGVVLTVAAAGVLPGRMAGALLVVALLLLAESFGRQVWWLWSQREREPEPVVAIGPDRAVGEDAAARMSA